jgi:hypothetical protein
MRRSTRLLMRRLFALVLAVGLLPAASGGAACVAHWVGGDLHAQSAGHAAHEGTSHTQTSVEPAMHEHAAHEHVAHAAHAPTAPTAAEHGGHGPHAPPSHDTDAPCTALAACGVLAAVDTPTPALARVAPAAVVRSGVSLAPPGPAPAPDVPPPRR